MSLKLKCLVLLAVVWICSIAYGQKTDFNNATYSNAWDDIGQVYLNDKGHLCIPNEIAGTARLLVFDYFFMPHPFDNRYEQDMIDMQVQIEDIRVEFHMYKAKEKQKKKAWLFVGMGLGFVAGVLPPIIISSYKRNLGL